MIEHKISVGKRYGRQICIMIMDQFRACDTDIKPCVTR